MPPILEVVVSSRNTGKLAEFRAILANLPLAIVSAADRGVADVEESGATLAENALLKASAAYNRTGLISIADDSGLFVEALDGAPGVYSARFAGENVTYEDNNRELLRQLEGRPESERGAAFVSVMALLVPTQSAPADDLGVSQGLRPPDGTRLFLVEGRLEGRITTAAMGDRGFGYDPVFYVPGAGRTLAQMDPQEKNAISHRGRALARLHACFQDILLRV